MKQLVHYLKLAFRVDDNRVFVAGHGTGADAAMDVASCHPDLFAGVVSVSALARTHLQWTAHNSPNLGWYIVQGERQPHWYQRNRILLTRLLKRMEVYEQHCNMVLVRYPNRGFESFGEEVPAAFEWMEETRRNPWPQLISADTMRSSDLSWHWLQLDSLPPRFQALETPTPVEQRVRSNGTVRARQTPGNGFDIRTAPANGCVLLSPEMPGLDVSKEIRVRARSRTRRVEFRPSVRDLLEHYAETGERIRQCHMKVAFRR